MTSVISLALFAALALPQAPASPQATPAPQAPVAAEVSTAPQGPAGQAPAAAPQPPAGSEPVVRTIEIAFPTQGNVSLIDPETYLYYIKTQTSLPSSGTWATFERQTVIDDFARLWATGFLDDLSIEVKDVPYENGVIGKHITYNIEERPKVRMVEYEGTGVKILETSKIEEALKEGTAQIKADGFLDPLVVQKARGIIRGLLEEKGYRDGLVTTRTDAIGGAAKTVTLTYHVKEGPKLRVARLRFRGNRQVSAGDLQGVMKSNKPQKWWLPSALRFLGEASPYQQAKFDEDAERIVAYYHDRGFIRAQIGTPEPRKMSDSRDRKSRWVSLDVPVTEGERYAVGEVTIEGNTVVKAEALRSLFKLEAGKPYAEKDVRKGLEKARDLYGAVGYYEFTGYPDLKPRETAPTHRRRQVSMFDSLKAVPMMTAQAFKQLWPWSQRLKRPTKVVDVTVRLQEGKQYFINRIAFEGNTVTRDTVIRRELGMAEGGVFNTEAMKYSIKRINQLGYFKPIEDQKGITIDKTPGTDDRVNLTVKVEEQNRNAINFGAGVSEWDGFFGNFSYTVANFLGRGESVTLAFQKGMRSNLYEVGFSEPYLFNRPLSASVDVYSRKYNIYLTTDKVGYSEVREGLSASVGYPIFRFSRLFLSYTFEVVDTVVSSDLKSLYGVGSTSAYGMPSFNYWDEGRHRDSRLAPMFVYNTVDNPMKPHSGMRISAGGQIASKALGGSYNYLKPELEAVVYIPTSRRTGFGLRGQGGWLATFGKQTGNLTYYLRYFLGGEYQIRGTDIRSVGPVDKYNRALGGNKFVLFNAEYYLDVASPIRLLAFHDAGQAYAEGRPINLRQLRTSSGLEARILVPMLNVPFRLIWAYNRYRDSFQPEFTFKFGVGATF